MYSPHFYANKFVKAAKLRQSVTSASYLTTQSSPLSSLHLSDLGVFQPSPGFSSMFSIDAPSSIFPLGG